MENNWLVWLVALVAIVGIFANFGYIYSLKNQVSDLQNKPNQDLTAIQSSVSGLSSQVSTLTSAVDGLKTAPTESQVTQVTPEVPSSKVDKLCELTDGCDYYKITGIDKDNAVNATRDYLNDNSYKKLISKLSPIVEIDKEYLEIDYSTIRDKKVIALTDDDKDDGNFVTYLILKVKYKDEDATDWETTYLKVTAELEDFTDVNSFTLETVDRTSELD